MINYIESYGRYPKLKHKSYNEFSWLADNPDFSDENAKYLAYGLGKSYGDSCLNPDGNLIGTRFLNKIINFDYESGILKVESGITLEKCIEFLLPKGWFLPVTPGTKLITIGGAVANDVHGKNHHVAGTFGCHVLSFELLRSDYSRVICSETSNYDLFKATIGGLGLTGIITWVEFKCIKCNGPMIEMESIKFRSFEEFFEINNKSKDYEFTVSWVDTNSMGCGLYSRGNFASSDKQIYSDKISSNQIPFPFDYDFINPISVYIFNNLYYSKQFEDKIQQVIHYNPFFYPLDAINGWNKAYGKRGFIQYQFVIPEKNGLETLTRIFSIITKSGNSSFLTVLKTFGDIKSPGMLSFPRPGITMAIDFKMTGKKVLELLNEADEIVKDVGGALYPAKDSRMSSNNFKLFYPNWEEFSKFIDSKFTSGFWTRVTGN